MQCVLHLARAAKALYVCQRTPSSVDVRAYAPIDPDGFVSIATAGVGLVPSAASIGWN